MDTESPAQRLSRRIGRDAPTEPAEGDDESEVALARWLPEDAGAQTPRDWVATVRADPGRAGVIGLLVVGVIAVLVTVFTVLRGPEHPVAAANLPAVQMVSTANTPAGPLSDL